MIREFLKICNIHDNEPEGQFRILNYNFVCIHVTFIFRRHNPVDVVLDTKTLHLSLFSNFYNVFKEKDNGNLLFQERFG